LEIILHFYEKASELVKRGVPLSLIREGKPVLEIVHVREKSKENIMMEISDLKRELDAFLEKVGSERKATRGRV